MTEKDDSTTQPLSIRVIEILLLAAIYFFTAKLGQVLAIPPGNVTLVWIPSGIIIAAIIWRGYGIWPGIFIGAIIGNISAYLDLETLSNLTPSLIAGIFNGMGDSLGAVVGVYLTRKYHGPLINLRTTSGMTGFILYCVIVYSVISAIFGVTSLASTGFISWQDYQNVWLTWAIGDAMGVLIISPLLLTIGRWTKDVWPNQKTTNLMVYLVVFSISMFLFMQTSPSESIEVSQFFILPLLLWPAFHFHQNITVGLVFFVTTLAVLFTVLGIGPFAGGELNTDVMVLNIFLASITVTVYVFSATMAEYNETNKQLMNYRENLKEIIQQQTTELRETNESLQSEIYERKEAEEELLRIRKLESVGILAGGIAHNFNNILTGIFGNIELAQDKLDTNHPARKNVDNATNALERARYLTNQLLTFAKGGEPVPETVSVNDVIIDAVKLSLSGSNVKTTLHLDENLWLVSADVGQLTQAITNLLINADQAMPEGGELIIQTENHKFSDEIPEAINIIITDNGCGIPVDNIKLIFDPYFSTKSTGSGLGLATSHSIISKHNGSISVQSTEGKGSRFTVCLPASSKLTIVQSTAETRSAEATEPRVGHVLIMDDEEVILELTAEAIESLGYQVETAINGEQAIDKYMNAKVSSNPFDLVIMDLTIPGGMGGKDTMMILKDFDPDIKAIVSSGYSTDQIMANYSDYGFAARLSKPFQLEELRREITRLI